MPWGLDSWNLKTFSQAHKPPLSLPECNRAATDAAGIDTLSPVLLCLRARALMFIGIAQFCPSSAAYATGMQTRLLMM